MVQPKELKAVIVGVGHVGATTANTLQLQDLTDSAAASGSYNVEVYAGSYKDCTDASFVIITAGHQEELSETHVDLLRAKYRNIQDVIPKIARYVSRSSILIIATHTVEALTYAAYKLSSLPSCQVFGCGTALTTSRFRLELAKHYAVNPRDVYAVIAGKHDSQCYVAGWSNITIDGVRVRDFCEQTGRMYEQEELFACYLRAKQAAIEIMESKGSPSFSMAAGLASIVKALVENGNAMLTVSVVGSIWA
ncbi:hypothetical protein LTR56_025673 [Elasticomyces elasticus]|nr:hypothetical protein LTR56_025673 [Elasticomyces elasticus]KAK3623973.1 hypothetical protein LTR22_024168 [Elasticomyces elasticus]